MQRYLQLLNQAKVESKHLLEIYNNAEMAIKVEGLQEIVSDNPILNRMEFISAKDINEITESLKSNNLFMRILGELKYEIALYIGADVVQKFCTFRVTEPKIRAGFFHRDSWVGHPHKIVNAWIPLSKLDAGNTLYSCNPRDTSLLVQQLSEGKISLETLDQKASKLAQPLLSDRPSAFLFSNDFLHGSFLNISHRRISIDFRMALSSEFSGSKIIGQDYEFIEHKNQLFSAKSKIESNCIILTFQKNDAQFVNHASQRMILKRYCDSIGFSIENEWSEFHGFTNFPQLKYCLRNYSMPIVIFSISCLKSQGKFIDPELNEIMLSYKPGVHFALENKTAKELIVER